MFKPLIKNILTALSQRIYNENQLGAVKRFTQLGGMN